MVDSAPVKVLCVDADPRLLENLHQQLKPRYQVLLASNAADALDLLRSDADIAAVIADLGLRTRDGFSLEELHKTCGVDLPAEKGAILAHAESDGLLHRKARRIEPTLKGLAVADQLAIALVPEALLNQGNIVK